MDSTCWGGVMYSPGNYRKENIGIHPVIDTTGSFLLWN